MVPERFSVSVAIPAYNEAARIATTIASVREQTEPPDEIVVVDDGSSDDTAALARACGARVVRQSNAGPAAARNRAIAEATCDWIAFCDADDLWLPQKLELTRRAHALRPSVGLIFGNCANEVAGRLVGPTVFDERPEYARHVTERVAGDVTYFDRRDLARGLVARNFLATSTLVVRRELLIDHDVAFDPDLARDPAFVFPEDLEFYLRLLRHTDALAVETVVEHYRRHAGSLSHDPSRTFYGLLHLRDVVLAHPERYAPGAAQAFEAMRREHLRAAAFSCARMRRFDEARALLGKARRVRFRPVDAALEAAAGIASMPGGAGVARLVTTAWRALRRRAHDRPRPTSA